MRVVVAAPLLPYPPDGGAKIRLLRHLSVLSRKHDVLMVTVVRNPAERIHLKHLADYCEVISVEAPHRKSAFTRAGYRLAYTAMAAARSWPMDAFYGCPGPFSEEVKAQAARLTADIVHYDFWFSAIGDLHAKPYRRVLLEHDVEYVRRKRDFENAPGSAGLKRRWLTTERAEMEVLRNVDTVLAVTERDAGEARAVGARQTIVLPTGIDTIACRPPDEEPTEPSLVFVGAYSHHPNVDAMVWFVEDIFPLIRRQVPGASLTIVGSAPPPRITDLGSRPGVTVTGAVPEVAPYIQAARVAVVPLRVGSGIKGKIIEAMAFGRPVVTTSVGAEGMGLTPGANVVLADEPEAFSSAVVDLLADPQKAATIGRTGRVFVEERHSQKKADERLLEIYESDIWHKGET